MSDIGQCVTNYDSSGQFDSPIAYSYYSEPMSYKEWLDPKINSTVLETERPSWHTVSVASPDRRIGDETLITCLLQREDKTSYGLKFLLPGDTMTFNWSYYVYTENTRTKARTTVAQGMSSTVYAIL